MLIDNIYSIKLKVFSNNQAINKISLSSLYPLEKAFSYNRKEKLKSKKQLDKLFETGKTFIVFPVKVFFAPASEQDNIIKAGVGVSRRNFKKAVHRNRIKRLLREAYRTEKLPLHTYLNSTEKKLAVFLLYIDKSLPGYLLLKEKMRACIQRIIKELNEVVTENT